MTVSDWGLMIWLILMPVFGVVSFFVFPPLVKALGLERASPLRLFLIGAPTYLGAGLLFIWFVERDQVALVFGIVLLVIGWLLWKLNATRRTESEPKP